jgi:acetyl-CoA carboxylase biotin carboxylase subunit
MPKTQKIIFLPDIGTLSTYEIPQGDNIRVDDGFEQGMQIPIFYDPMIAKLIVYGKNRDEAIERMKFAIARYKIEGIKTTLKFGDFVMNHPDFITGNFDTKFVEKNFHPNDFDDNETQMAALAAALFFDKYNHNILVVEKGNVLDSSNWKKNRV